MLRNPFYPDRKRHIYYYIYVFLIIIVTIFLIKNANIDWESISNISILPEPKDNPQDVVIPEGVFFNNFVILAIV